VKQNIVSYFFYCSTSSRCNFLLAVWCIWLWIMLIQ